MSIVNLNYKAYTSVHKQSGREYFIRAKCFFFLTQRSGLVASIFIVLSRYRRISLSRFKFNVRTISQRELSHFKLWQGRPIRLRIMRFREAASKSHNIFWAQDMSVISLSVNAIFTYHLHRIGYYNLYQDHYLMKLRQGWDSFSQSAIDLRIFPRPILHMWI